MIKLSREIYVCKTETTGRLEMVVDKQATAQQSMAPARHAVEAKAWRRRYAPVLDRGKPAPAVAEEAEAWRRKDAPVSDRGAPAPAVAEEAEAWRRRRRRRDAPVLDRGAPAPRGPVPGAGGCTPVHMSGRANEETCPRDARAEKNEETEGMDETGETGISRISLYF